MVNKKVTIGVGLLVLIIGLLVFGWRTLLVGYLTPPMAFTVSGDSIPPDYKKVESWVSHPSKSGSAMLLPNGHLPSSDTREAAVFYVHPTTYFGPKGWNWIPDADTYAEQGIEHTIATQASAFNDCCDIFAPYYRQAHIGAFGWQDNDSGLQSLNLAYEDVERAFDEFLEEIGPDKPFFLAGHSQGSAHLQRLVVERISGQPERARLIVAYIVGYWIPVNTQPRAFPDIPYCSSPDMTGCIVTWDSYDRGAETHPEFSVPHWFPEGWERHDEVNTVCINPLDWRMHTDLIEKDRNLGAIETQPAGNTMDIFLDRNPGHYYRDLGHVLPAASSAECTPEGHLLADSQVDNEFERSGHGDSGSYHAFDWNLFYMNIRENVSRRLSAHLTRHGLSNVSG